MPLAAEGFAFDRTPRHRVRPVDHATLRATNQTGCALKRVYPSAAAARRAIDAIRRAEALGQIDRSPQPGRLEAYRCAAHGGWHVGHRNPLPENGSPRLDPVPPAT